MNVFTSFSFVQHLIQLISEVPSNGVGELALEFCRHALFDYSLAHLPPSQISISALACSCQLLNLDHRPLMEELAARDIVMIVSGFTLFYLMKRLSSLLISISQSNIFETSYQRHPIHFFIHRNAQKLLKNFL